MRLLIKNGLLHSKNGGHSEFKKGALVVTDNKISKISYSECDNEGFDKVIDAKECLVIPGIVNAHLHTHDHFNKGGFDNLPLELWMLSLRPISTGMTHTEDEIYLRTLYGCIEMFKTGTTTIIDDIVQTNILDEGKINAVLKAYDKAGMRGYITTMTSDKSMYDTIPYLDKYFTDEQKQAFAKAPMDVKAVCDFQEELVKARLDKNMKYALSPSAPQRCTDELLCAVSELSKKYKVPAICHVLETKVQAVTGQYFNGKSLLRNMKEIGALHEYFNIIHMVHATEDDIAIMKEFGCKVVHNPVSNLKLGNGIAPIREILNAGISVGLGTDNTSCNDSINMFESMKFASTLHKIEYVDPGKWVGAEDAFDMATMGGADCALMKDEIGQLEVGRKADIAIIDTDNYIYQPSSDYLNSMVFCDNGNSVKHLIIDGKVVMEDKIIKTFDEQAVLSEIKGLLPRIMAENSLSKEEAKPYLGNINKAYLAACEDFKKTHSKSLYEF